MQICGRCGTYAPPEATLCDGCNAALRSPGDRRRVHRDRFRIAAVRLARTCTCGARTPIDGLPADGIVRCGACDATATLPSSVWTEVLDRAHAVADLLGPDPEGFERSAYAVDRVNPFAALGATTAVIRFERPPPEVSPLPPLPPELRMTVAPGAPLDGDTGKALPFEVMRDGQLVTRGAIEPCGYGVDERFLDAFPALCGVIARDHLVEPRDPDVTADPQTGRWLCPACGGPIGARDGTRFRVRCPACSARAAVPPTLRYRGTTDARPDTIWFVFDGPSPERLRLERDPRVAGAHTDGDRPLRAPGRVADTLAGRALAAAYVAALPAALFVLAGVASRLPAILASLSAP